jgi:hypothetical protein
MPASHRRAIADILACRTEALGGHLWRCDHCHAEVFAYHSYKNRSCSKCHTEQTRAWLERRHAESLPAPYFHVTITVPDELRPMLRANQRDGYSALIQTAAEAIIELARDRRFVGGNPGSSTSRHGLAASLRCSITLLATSFASPSPTAASSASMSTP